MQKKESLLKFAPLFMYIKMKTCNSCAYANIGLYSFLHLETRCKKEGLKTTYEYYGVEDICKLFQ